jgi:hypothetical protein
MIAGRSMKHRQARHILALFPDDIGEAAETGETPNAQQNDANRETHPLASNLCSMLSRMIDWAVT